MACHEGCTLFASSFRRSLATLLSTDADVKDSGGSKVVTIGAPFIQPTSIGAKHLGGLQTASTGNPSVQETLPTDQFSSGKYSEGLNPESIDFVVTKEVCAEDDPQKSVADYTKVTRNVPVMELGISGKDHETELAAACNDNNPSKDARVLLKMNTVVLVDEVMEKRNRAFTVAILQSCFGFITLALDIIGFAAKADQECDEDLFPGWGSYFIAHAVMIIVIMSLQVLMFYALAEMWNRHCVTAQVHLAKGKQLEAQKDLEQGLERKQKGQSLLLKAVGTMCLVAMFGLGWLVVGILMAVNSENKTCDDAKTWFWVIISSNIVYVLINSVHSVKPSKEQALSI